jgi:hypothetical protein
MQAKAAPCSILLVYSANFVNKGKMSRRDIFGKLPGILKQ